MAREWKIAPGGVRCETCQGPFPPEGWMVSGLYLTDGQLTRRDYCDECFPGLEEEAAPFSFWRSRTAALPQDGGEEEVIPRDHLLELFLRARDRADSRQELSVTFLFGMVLLQRKRLRVVRTEPEGLVVVGRGADVPELVLVDPGLPPDELEHLWEEVEAGLGLRLMPA